MRTRACLCLSGLWMLMLLAAPLPAQDKTEPDRFTIGFEERVRSDDWNNALDMSDKANDQRDQLRERTRLWVNIPAGSGVNFFGGINEETTHRVGAVSRFDEVFFDQAYVDFRKLFVKGLEVKLGRFDLFKGEGFVLCDGTPGDGPRSNYFNGADVTYTAGKQSVDLFGALDPARERFLPTFHDQRRLLQNWDEQAVGAYYTNSMNGYTPFEVYYILKKEIHDVLPVSNPQFQPDRHVSTLGGRVVRSLGPRTTWATEYARQWGAQHGGVIISGWGGYSYVKHTFNRARKPYVKAGYWAMSGDDPKTPNRIEGWDPLFSQYPKWSDMYVYTLSKEISIAYWSNLRMSQAEAGFSPFRKTTLAFIWYHMDSFHPFARTGTMFGPGTARGENLQTRFEYAPSPSWRAYIHYETHHPGDYYAANRAPAYEVQAQVTYRLILHPLDKAAK